MPTTLTLAVTGDLLAVQAVKQPPTAPPELFSTVLASFGRANLAWGA